MRGAFAFALLAGCGGAVSEAEGEAAVQAPSEDVLRVATYNVSFFREEPGQLSQDIAAWTDPQMQAVAGVIGSVDPDVLVLNEFDYEENAAALAAFAERLGYAHHLALASNTGIASGRDLDKDGRADHPPGSREYGGDAFGYGTHEGQYGIAVISKLPLDAARVRTFRTLLWQDLPENRLPTEYYDEGDQAVLRLSSKTHAIVPVGGADGFVLLLAHPTPPGFDGPEDRNGRRNADEIRLLADIALNPDAGYLTADDGSAGGIERGTPFVIAGDLNADPSDGDGTAAIGALLSHRRILDPQPRSSGGPQASSRQGEANAEQSGDPALDTADFSDGGVGNLRVDYVLPSSDFEVAGAGVFWPAEGEVGYDLVGPGYPPVSSDHRLVWVDLRRAR